MDIFNRKKIEKYERDIMSMKEDMDALKKENDTLKRKLSGERVCSGYCAVCENSVAETRRDFMVGTYTTYTCVLDCKCRDFSRKEG